jgi:hypothetical protein
MVVNYYNQETREGLEMNVRTMGIDLAKNRFRVHGVDDKGRIVLQRQLRRRQLLPFVAQLRPLPRGDGGVRRRPLLGSQDRQARS